MGTPGGQSRGLLLRTVRSPLPLRRTQLAPHPCGSGSSNEAAASDVDTVSTSTQLSRQRDGKKKEAQGPQIAEHFFHYDCLRVSAARSDTRAFSFYSFTFYLF
jgi:alpha/beta superfamily hydrolase